MISAPLPHQIETKWPLTPAPSVASSSSVPVEAGPSTRRSPRKSALASVASTIKAKVRGAGQIALSKPKTRQTKREPVKRKRYQFDSDEEDEDAHVEHWSGSANVKTPKKEASTSVPTGEADLPKIVVQEATPLKEPLPTPKKRLGQRGSIEEGLPKKRSRSRSPDGSPTPFSSASTEVSVTVSEAVIPSPATEDDQPAFSVETPKGDSPAQAVESEQQVDQSHLPTSNYQNTLTKFEVDEAIPDGVDANEQDEIPNEGIPTNARLLQPSSTFESFTLWSPDGPLPGFKQDESNTQATEGEEAEGEGGEQGGVKLRKGWWRTGGAGEGGDEIVRALGEWIGLVDEVHFSDALVRKKAYRDS